MSSDLRVSVVVPILNGAAVVGRQIDALIREFDATRPPTGSEIVLVDNGSTDDTAQVLRSYASAHSEVRAEHEPRRGINPARNRGIRTAQGDVVLLCDADDEVMPGWLEGMTDGLRDADLVGGALIPMTRTGEAIEYAQPWSHRLLWEYSSPYGCSCGFRRDVWVALGGFDDRLPIGGDEVDFFLRAQLRGFTLAWAKDAYVRYYVDLDSGQEMQKDAMNERNFCGAYWYGRLHGKPSRHDALRDLRHLASLSLGATVSANARREWQTVARRRWNRAIGWWMFFPRVFTEWAKEPSSRSRLLHRVTPRKRRATRP